MATKDNHSGGQQHRLDVAESAESFSEPPAQSRRMTSTRQSTVLPTPRFQWRSHLFRLLVVSCAVVALGVDPGGDTLERGLAAALVLSLSVAPMTKWASSGWPVTYPPGLERLGNRGDTPGPLMIGVLEAVLMYFVVVSQAWTLAAGYLVFKGTSKWASWQHIMKFPEKMENAGSVSETDYILFRWAWSSRLLMAFLFGTLANVLVAILAARIGPA